MMEDILKNLIQSNGENLLVNAAEAVIKKSKDKTAWKKLAEICSRDPGSSLGTYLAKYWKQGKYQEKEMDGNESLPI